MGNANDTHFDTYREQTRVKHQLLADYLPPYLGILGTTHPNLVYFDGFAGRGHYSDGATSVPGSPLLAISLIAGSAAFKDKVQCYFNEENLAYFQELDRAVRAHPALSQLTKKPHVTNMKFSELMRLLRQHLATNDKGLAPTFLFVDPCGVDDVRMEDLAEMLKKPWCELFLFLNYEGLNRIIGLAEQTGRSPTLLALMGSQQRHDAILADCSRVAGGRPRELVILRHFIEALKVDSRAEFVLPFRIEHERKRQTSHYLVHATKYPPAFRIMKSIMYKAARATGSDGCLELLQASDRGEAMIFEDPSVTKMKEEVLRSLADGPKPVDLYKIEWTERALDLISTEEYKKVILDLEAEGKVVVLGKDGCPRPASKRISKGEVTLGSTCSLRLK